MNARFWVSAAVWFTCLAAVSPTGLAAETYDVDTSHTSIVFSVSHINMSYTYGFFRKSQGRYMLDRTNPANSRFQFSIAADSLDTNNADRDKHLRSPDFFNVQQFPTITFESTSVTQSNTESGVEYQVTGNLTMHGVTRQITIPLKMLGEGVGPYGKYRSGFFGQFSLKRSDFGMSNLLNMVGDAVGVTVSFEGIRQEAAGGVSPPPPRSQ